MQYKLDRCDLEIAITKRYTHGFLAIYNAMGNLDWLIEKQMIEEEHKEMKREKDYTGPQEELAQVYMETFVADALRTEPDYTAAITRLSDPRTVRLLHVAMGLATEAGEFVDTLKKHIFYGKPIDRVNLIEELGDSTWYERIGVNELEIAYAEMLTRNVEKLKARFPDKFTEGAALNRDLVRERGVLEGGEGI